MIQGNKGKKTKRKNGNVRCKKKKKNRKTKNDYRLIYVYMNERIIKEKKSSKTELKISWTVSKKKQTWKHLFSFKRFLPEHRCELRLYWLKRWNIEKLKGREKVFKTKYIIYYLCIESSKPTIVPST